MGLGGPAQRLGPVLHGEHLPDVVGQKIGRSGLVQPPLRAVFQQAPDTAHICRNAGHPQQHGFPQGVGGIFDGGAEAEHIGLQIFRFHLLLGQMAQKAARPSAWALSSMANTCRMWWARR